ncbi:MAG: hypothetical protein HOY79_17690 [Streptomyces sp.]|nr:hypothetical protein [Streptomyces sp.]
MSVTVEPVAPEPHRRRRVANWIGHRWMLLFVVLLCVAAPMDLFGRHGVAIITVKFLWSAAIATVMVLGINYDQNLCEPCIAAMPLDGSAEAERRQRRLHITHLGRGFAGPVVYIAFLLLPTLLPAGPIRFGGDVVALAPAAYWWLALYTHRRLAPWCPWCHWGGGGDGVHEPSPSPSINTPTPA